MTEEQFAKLPKFARDEIGRLRANARRAEERLSQMLRPAEDDRPAYGDYDEFRGMGLPCRKVRFPKYGLEIYVGHDGVEIRGDGRLTILPQVTNAIAVQSERVDRD